MTHPNTPHTAQRIEFRDLVHDAQGPPAVRQQVIATREDYEAWIAACTGSQEAFPHDIDFTGEMLIAVALGREPPTGHGIRITSIGEVVGGVVGIQWQVLYRVEATRADVPAAPEPVCPQHVVRTRRFDGPVTFRPAADDGEHLGS